MIVIFGQEINLLSQAFGLVALALIVTSYFCSRQKFLAVLSIAFVFCIAEFAVLNRFSICISYGVSICRNITQMIYTKKQKNMPWWFSIVFVVAVLAVGIPVSNYWYDFMPLLATICFVAGNHLKSFVALKYVCAFNEVLNISYALLVHSPVGALREVIALVAIIASIVASAKADKTKNKEQPLTDKPNS